MVCNAAYGPKSQNKSPLTFPFTFFWFSPELGTKILKI